jgi:hypothetical protein
MSGVMIEYGDSIIAGWQDSAGLAFLKRSQPIFVGIMQNGEAFHPPLPVVGLSQRAINRSQLWSAPGLLQ